jgi:hypothetical protein
LQAGHETEPTAARRLSEDGERAFPSEDHFCFGSFQLAAMEPFLAKSA